MHSGLAALARRRTRTSLPVLWADGLAAVNLLILMMGRSCQYARLQRVPTQVTTAPARMPSRWAKVRTSVFLGLVPIAAGMRRTGLTMKRFWQMARHRESATEDRLRSLPPRK